MTSFDEDLRTVLVVAAHPDDEVLGCGGTIAALAQRGHAVFIAILGEGVTSRVAHRAYADPAVIAELRASSQRAAAHLGAKEVVFHDFPDNRFDSVPLLDVVKEVETLVTRVRPDVVFTQHPGDLNIDHVIVHRAVLTATRPLAACPVREVYAFEVGSSSDWAFHQFRPAFNPNLFVDIAATLQVKIAALGMYESEGRPFPHPRSPEAVLAAARRWGSVAGCEAAEAFEVVRIVR